MLSQVLARALCGLVFEGDLPAELRAAGVTARDLSALRLAPGPRGAL